MRANVRSRKSRSSCDRVRLLGLGADVRHRLDRLDRVACRRRSRPTASPRRCRRAPRWRRRRPRRASAPGAWIIDSIICVAVMVSLLRSRAMPDHPLLQRRHRGVADLDGEVAARDHDAVGRVDDLLERARSPRRARSWRSAARWPPAARSSWRAMYMSSSFFGKRHREVVGVDRAGGLDVVHVLGRQRGRGQAAALAVDALVVGQRRRRRTTRVCDLRRRRPTRPRA